jgi:hypothetical protein
MFEQVFYHSKDNNGAIIMSKHRLHKAFGVSDFLKKIKMWINIFHPGWGYG